MEKVLLFGLEEETRKARKKLPETNKKKFPPPNSKEKKVRVKHIRQMMRVIR